MLCAALPAVEKTFSAKLKQLFGESTVLKVLSSEMDPAKIRLIRKVFVK
jgi:hypothetical protein